MGKDLRDAVNMVNLRGPAVCRWCRNGSQAESCSRPACQIGEACTLFVRLKLIVMNKIDAYEINRAGWILLMRLNELLKRSGLQVIDRSGEGDPRSRISVMIPEAGPASLFVSIPGTRLDGDLFIADALSRGAAAVISEKLHPGLAVPCIKSVNLRSSLGRLGAALWKVNFSGMICVAVTGTNGKTTTAHLYEQLLCQRIPSEQIWMFGTVDFHLGGKRIPASHTTPEALDILRWIGESEHRPSGLVMEVSSHSLALDRIGGLLYNAAVWTNLTQDHLDFHHDMESYYQAKSAFYRLYGFRSKL